MIEYPVWQYKNFLIPYVNHFVEYHEMVDIG